MKLFQKHLLSRSLILVLILVPFTLQAAVLTIGSNTTGFGNINPFGRNGGDGGPLTTLPFAYQQVYLSSSFTSPVIINSLSFADFGNITPGVTANYTVDVRLGTTALTPESTGSIFGNPYAGSFVTAFAGVASAALTTTAGDFDFTITLTTPYTYDPSAGNLLFYVNVFDVSGSSSINGNNHTFGFAYEGGTPLFGSISASGSNANGGLVTQFNVTSVPETSTAALFGLAVVGLMLRRRP